MDAFDVVVIGGGPGGYIAAIRAAQLGLKTACLDDWRGADGKPALGGTCTNVGCIPSKALLQSSEYFEQAGHQFADHGVKVNGLELDLAQMLKRKDKVVKASNDGVLFLFRKNKIQFFHGRGSFGAADEQIAREAAKMFARQGLAIELGSKVNKVSQSRKDILVQYTSSDNSSKTLECDRLIVSIGRLPNTDGLNAAAVGLKVDERGFIAVDGDCRTNLPNVWAIGDVVRGPMLAHKAEEEGVAVAERIVGQKPHVDFNTVPWGVFTTPESAWVGGTQQQLKGRGARSRPARDQHMRWYLFALVIAAAGCSMAPWYYATQNEHVLSLGKGDLEAAGIAFITPSTVTGQEQEKQTVALAFADVMAAQRPGVKVVTLAETLSAVNRAGLVDAYRRMYEDYRDTALLPAEVLRRLGASTGARYIGQLKLQGFSQNSKNRLGILGLRIIDTQLGDV